MKDRIAKIIKKERLTSQQFAEIIEIQSSTISHILAGRNLPSCKILTNIVEKFPNISSDWLLLGKGEMYRGAEKYPIFEPTIVAESPIVEFTDVISNDPVTAVNKEGIDEGNMPVDENDNMVQESVDSEKNIVNCAVVPQKIIVMYSDNSFEIFHSK